tara:strand:+ start:1166 stop:1639 length:474 start_codon:yes stop_codon:yes gene_type:complete
MNFLSKKVVHLLTIKKLKISTAESCTGGLLSSVITSINGSSKIYKLGLIVYSNESKIKILKISKKKIKKYGAVSEQICRDMVNNINKIAKTDISISVTGIAGPKGGTKKKPVGLVYIGIKKLNKITIYKYLFKNKRRLFIQKATVNKCLTIILNTIK